MTDRQRNTFVLLLVAGLLAASAVVFATKKTFLGLDLKGGVELVYKASPTQQSAVTADSLARAVDIMRQRVDQLGVSQPEISTQGKDQIVVGLPDVTDTQRAENEVGRTARLEFYDWEANALTSSGKPVKDGLLAQDPSSVSISQGSSGAPGGPGGGSMSLYNAVKLAAKQPASINPGNARKGPQFYLFGTGGSAACAAAAKAYNVSPSPAGQHCLLAGPDTSVSEIQNGGLPAGVTMSQGQLLQVKQGTVVLQATPTDFAHPASIADPTTQFYVLKDNVALFGNDITNPQQSTDTGGNPDVTFGFTGSGGSKFQSVTSTIAHRGQGIGSPTQPLLQHFAVALDNILITVPSIDFRTYPDGIDGSTGAQITGGFTIQSAQDLATQLRDGALPITLKQISSEQVSATSRRSIRASSPAWSVWRSSRCSCSSTTASSASSQWPDWPSTPSICTR
jgi:SecD/SecF fusion protein